MNEWKKRNDCMEICFFCDLLSANVFGTPRGGGKCRFFRPDIFSRPKLNERKSLKADVPKVRLGLSANKTWGESVQMYLVLTKSRLVFMETSVVLFRRSFLFRSTNRNWSTRRGTSPQKWPPDNLFPLETCLCRRRFLLLQWFPMENK